MNTPREALTSLRDLFSSTHWAKGHFHEDEYVDGGWKETYCAIGGCRLVAGISPDFDVATEYVEDEYDQGTLDLYGKLLLPLARHARPGAIARAEAEGPGAPAKLDEYLPKWLATLDEVEARGDGTVLRDEMNALESIVIVFNDYDETVLDDILAMVDAATAEVAA